MATTLGPDHRRGLFTTPVIHQCTPRMKHSSFHIDDTLTPSIKLATFFIGTALCGMNILKVQEINKVVQLTKVARAPDYVLGVQNLRGQIVTVIDLGKKLGLGTSNFSSEARNIIVASDGGHVGLLVNRIGDVVQVDGKKLEPPPANMRGIQGEFFQKVYKSDAVLIGILDIEKVLNLDE
ncbi:MAG: chemotaxis protein CheW [Desulfopila sp.]